MISVYTSWRRYGLLRQTLTDLEVSRISRGLQLDKQYTRFFYLNAFVGLRDALIKKKKRSLVCRFVTVWLLGVTCKIQLWKMLEYLVFRRVLINSEKRLLALLCLSVGLSVCLSLHMHPHRSYWMDFRKIWYWRRLRQSVEKFQNWLKSD